MSFLDSGGDLGRDEQFNVSYAATRSAIPAKESDRAKSKPFSLFEGAPDILGLTAGGQSDEEIAGRAEGLYLSGE